MPIKLNFENEIHLLNIEPHSFLQLKQLIVQSYNQLKDKSLIFKYTDIEDGDIITISCDSDLEIFLQEFKKHNKTPKILIEIDQSMSILPQSEFDIISRIESQFQTIQMNKDFQPQTDMISKNEKQQSINTGIDYENAQNDDSLDEQDFLEQKKSNGPCNIFDALINKFSENNDQKQMKKEYNGMLKEKKFKKIREIVREEIINLVKEECLKLFDGEKVTKSRSKSNLNSNNDEKLFKKQVKSKDKKARKASQSGSRSPVVSNNDQETCRNQKKARQASQSGSKSPVATNGDEQASKNQQETVCKGSISNNNQKEKKELLQQQRLQKEQEKLEKQRIENEEKAKKMQEKLERKEKLERIKQAKLELELKKQAQRNAEENRLSEPVFGAKINNVLINENSFESTNIGKNESPVLNMIPVDNKNGSIVQQPQKLVTPSIYEVIFNNISSIEPGFLKLDKAVVLEDFKNLNIVNVNQAYNWYLDQNIKF